MGPTFARAAELNVVATIRGLEGWKFGAKAHHRVRYER
jgi:hypothetical protein